MPKNINLVGQKFGKLSVLEITSERKRKNIVWKCLCECGEITYKITTDLVNNRLQSCGCILSEFNKTKLLPSGEYGLNRLFKNYRESAENKNRIFNLSKEDFKKLTQLNCFYCGAIPHSVCQPSQKSKTSEHAFDNGKYVYNGLDRIDNNIGYVITNVVTCCENCNRAKLKMLQEDFILLANRIAKLHPRETDE